MKSPFARNAKWKAVLYPNDDESSNKKYMHSCDRHNNLVTTNSRKQEYTPDFCEECMDEFDSMQKSEQTPVHTHENFTRLHAPENKRALANHLILHHDADPSATLLNPESVRKHLLLHEVKKGFNMGDEQRAGALRRMGTASMHGEENQKWTGKRTGLDRWAGMHLGFIHDQVPGNPGLTVHKNTTDTGSKREGSHLVVFRDKDSVPVTAATLNGNKVEALYSDRRRGLLHAIGTTHVARHLDKIGATSATPSTRFSQQLVAHGQSLGARQSKIMDYMANRQARVQKSIWFPNEIEKAEPHIDSNLGAVAASYMANRGLKHEPAAPRKANPSVGAAIARHYEAAPDTAPGGAVKRAYHQFGKEVDAQWDHLHSHGYKLEPWKGEGQPYKNSAEVHKDVRENKHLHYFTGGTSPNSLMPEKTNERFRAVHDVFGHAMGGHSFGPSGEESAWAEHSKMFSPTARAAMTTETRGQNSWVNFGPHGEHNRANPGDTVYAKQKGILLPHKYQKSINDYIEKGYNLTNEGSQRALRSLGAEHTTVHDPELWTKMQLDAAPKGKPGLSIHRNVNFAGGGMTGEKPHSFPSPGSHQVVYRDHAGKAVTLAHISTHERNWRGGQMVRGDKLDHPEVEALVSDKKRGAAHAIGVGHVSRVLDHMHASAHSVTEDTQRLVAHSQDRAGKLSDYMKRRAGRN